MTLSDLKLRLRYWKKRLDLLFRGVRPRQVTTYLAISELSRRYQTGERPLTLTASELKAFSQNGEDGVICALVNCIGSNQRTFVEFGIGAGLEGNCVYLADVLGWSGMFIEAHRPSFDMLSFKYSSNPRVTTLCEFVTPDNLDDLVASAGLPDELDVLSIDIDSVDLWILEGVRRLRPRVLIVEYNADLPVDEQWSVPRNWSGSWRLDNIYGASLGAFVELARRKGYTLVHTEMVGSNAFFVRDDLVAALGELAADPAIRRTNQFLVGARHSPGEWRSVMVQPDFDAPR